MNQYKIETTLTFDNSQYPEDTDHIYISKHIDFINAPTPIQAMRKLGLPQIISSESLSIYIDLVPETEILKYPTPPKKHYKKSK